MTDARIPDEIAWTLVDPTAYAGPRIHDTYKWLRTNNPLGIADLAGHYDPFWVVTKHADILEVSRQNALFHSGDRPTTLTSQIADAQVRKMTGGSPHLVRSLVQMDAPDHPKYRALTQAWFMPNNIRGLEARIRGIARGAVETMLASGGECDFVRDVAMLYPLHVIMEILGVPEPDEPLMLKLTQEMFGSTDHDMNRSGAEVSDVESTLSVHATMMDLARYFSEIIEELATVSNTAASIVVGQHQAGLSIMAAGNHPDAAVLDGGGVRVDVDVEDPLVLGEGVPVPVPGDRGAVTGELEDEGLVAGDEVRPHHAVHRHGEVMLERVRSGIATMDPGDVGAARNFVQ